MATDPPDTPKESETSSPPESPASPAEGSSEPQPTIHEATLAPGPSGAVEWGGEIAFADAVARRSQGLDIVVRGPDGKANARVARQVETQVGTPITFDRPHARAGPRALPHYHQTSRSPGGHSFYEVGKRRAKKRKS